MHPEKNNPLINNKDSELPAAESGNASNPSPHAAEAPAENQLLDAHAEKYLREVASIEDLPDAQDQQEMDDAIEERTDEAPK